MASDLRRSFAVTFTDGEDPEVAACLRDLDAVTARLQELAAAGKCTFHDTMTKELEPIRTFSYDTVHGYFKVEGNRSKLASHMLQALFDMRTPTGERAVRFYCTGYHHLVGVCTCPKVTWPASLEPRRIIYRSLRTVAVARGWLVDRDDVLALTDEQLATMDAHPNTRQYTTDFVVWLRANPDAR